jgi:hypothetical protein
MLEIRNPDQGRALPLFTTVVPKNATGSSSIMGESLILLS